MMFLHRSVLCKRVVVTEKRRFAKEEGVEQIRPSYEKPKSRSLVAAVADFFFLSFFLLSHKEPEQKTLEQIRELRVRHKKGALTELVWVRLRVHVCAFAVHW